MEQFTNKNDSVLEDDKCIFTFEPILSLKQVGILSDGTMYNYDQIKKYLNLGNNTSPLTKKLVFPKIVKVVNKNDGNFYNQLKRERGKIIHNTSLNSANFLYNKYTKLYQDKINQNYKPNDQDCISILYKFYEKNGSFDLELDASFIDFKHKKTLNKGHFKNWDFSGSNLSNMIFIDCDFSRTKFIGTNLEFTVFVRCTFKGDVYFQKSICNSKTKFDSCEIEPIGQWISVQSQRELERFKNIIKNRGINPSNINIL